MTALLLSHDCYTQFGDALKVKIQALGSPLNLLPLPQNKDARLNVEELNSVKVAFFSQDLIPHHSRQFFSSVRQARALEWLHVFNVGVDHPIYSELLQRGVRITTSAGTTAEPIAQTALAGLLMLSRGFPRWLKAQTEHRWAPQRLQDSPRDLSGQTVLIYGLGSIGRHFARFAKTLGLKVIGVQRRARQPDDLVDEIHPPTALDALLPRAQWLLVSCPLTSETQKLFNAERLARLPRGAYVLNVARGEVFDEAALTEALREGHLGGAYLDVFEVEPLPTDSALWDLPNVIITPHNATTALGNQQRVLDCFLSHLQQWHQGQPLSNEVFL